VVGFTRTLVEPFDPKPLSKGCGNCREETDATKIFFIHSLCCSSFLCFSTNLCRGYSLILSCKSMDRYHETLDVYTDHYAAGNHFAVRGKMSSEGDSAYVPDMDEAWAGNRIRGIPVSRLVSNPIKVAPIGAAGIS